MRVEAPDTNRFRDLFGPYKLDNARGRHDFTYGFALSPELQRAEGLLNAAALPDAPYADDDPFDAVRRLAKGPRDQALRDVGFVVSQPGFLLRGLHSRLVKRQKVRRKVKRMGFLVVSEQLPNPDSRVQLGRRLDRLGLPVAMSDGRGGEL